MRLVNRGEAHGAPVAHRHVHRRDLLCNVRQRVKLHKHVVRLHIRSNTEVDGCVAEVVVAVHVALEPALGALRVDNAAEVLGLHVAAHVAHVALRHLLAALLKRREAEHRRLPRVRVGVALRHKADLRARLCEVRVLVAPRIDKGNNGVRLLRNCGDLLLRVLGRDNYGDVAHEDSAHVHEEPLGRAVHYDQHLAPPFDRVRALVAEDCLRDLRCLNKVLPPVV